MGLKRLGEDLKVVVLAAVVGAGVAATYYYFEYAVRHSTSYVWDSVFGTSDHRLVVVPVCLLITLVYFGAQHRFDPKAEKHESHGLGDTPKPTVLNFVKVLSIGFLSLLAGASLGPEAILVPACVLLGSFVGIKLSGGSKPAAGLLGMAGFIALMASFFNSFFVGLLAILMVRKQFKTKVTARLVITAVAASGSAALSLGVLKSSAYVRVPHYSWGLDIKSLLILAILGAAGYCTTYGLGAAHKAGEIIVERVRGKSWWFHGLVAAAGLSLLYLLGGTLVQFTGNESIVPMFKQSADLGFLGLVWILFVKLLAIGWSKAGGYRGGLIFPTIFVAGVLVAIAQIFTNDLNVIYGLIVVMAGVLAADSKVEVLL